jgi:glycosyltransferase involved in cell wall biosynthesis
VSRLPSDRLRIAYVYDALYPFRQGGAERRYHELARRMAADHEVHMVSWGHPAPVPAALDGLTVHAVGRAPELYGDDGRRTVREAAAFAVRLVPALLRLRVDVIDCSATPYLPVYGCAAAARATRTPLVVTWHEYWGEYWHSYLPDRPLVARAAQLAEARCRSLGDRVVAVSAFTARRVAVDGRGPAPQVVGNGVDLASIDAASPAADEIDVLFVGRLIADKRVDDLLRALARLRSDGLEVRAAVVGDGPERTNLAALAAGLGLGPKVRFTGHLPTPEVFGLMRRAKLLVLPSVREGYGITVVEAQAAGAVPVVVRSPMSAAAELVRDGVDGRLADPTPDSLAVAMGVLLRSPGERSRLRGAARRAAEDRDWGRAADAMQAVYREAIAQRQEPRLARRVVSTDG